MRCIAITHRRSSRTRTERARVSQISGLKSIADDGTFSGDDLVNIEILYFDSPQSRLLGTPESTSSVWKGRFSSKNDSGTYPRVVAGNSCTMGEFSGGRLRFVGNFFAGTAVADCIENRINQGQLLTSTACLTFASLKRTSTVVPPNRHERLRC